MKEYEASYKESNHDDGRIIINYHYKFKADNDKEAKSIASAQECVYSADLDSLRELRPIELTQNKKQIKKISFNDELECLVDQENNRYEGRRMKTINLSLNFPFPDTAKECGLNKLEKMAIETGADAYEVINLVIGDSQQEFKLAELYLVKVNAILYKSKGE